MTGLQADLFPVGAEGERPLTLYCGEKHFHYMRHRNGQAQKCTLRSNVRGGRIVATIFTGEEDARYIMEAVNFYTEHKARERARNDG